MGNVVVIDIGKTLSKVSLWTADGQMIERMTRPNERIEGPGYMALDAAGIENWLVGALRKIAVLAPIKSIVPVAHGAAFALVRDGKLLVPPVDYEQPIPNQIRVEYERLRDPFAETGSPVLPDGLNAGVQLYWLKSLRPEAFDGKTKLLPWAQYWAWLLSGVAASEVTSLGCHTDLWKPQQSVPSSLAEHTGWASMLAPLRRASEPLGTLRPDWAAATGLSEETVVHCGLHDSNAALIAARGLPEIGEGESTVLSTGTWFVAMRTTSESVRAMSLPEGRDCLMNVDAYECTVPSARFMGGREIELLTGRDSRRVDFAKDQPDLVDALPRVLSGNARILPSFAAGCGPFPHARGHWVSMPGVDAERRAAVCLYAALMADVALDLIGSRDKLLIEGRFAEVEVLVRALAALRPHQVVHTAHAHNDVSYGALRLLSPRLKPPAELRRVEPLAYDLSALRSSWRSEADAMERSA